MSRHTGTNGPMAGGFLIAISLLVGAFWGGLHQQATLGFLAGLAIGVVLAAVVVLWDRRSRS